MTLTLFRLPRFFLSTFLVIFLYQNILPVSKHSDRPRRKGVVEVPRLKTNDAIVAYAVGDIMERLHSSSHNLAAVYCTYKLKGTRVVSKAIKTHFNGYRVKPDYSKKCFLNESLFLPDKIVQIKFSKHSDKIFVKYRDPRDGGRQIYSESLDATQYNFTEQS